MADKHKAIIVCGPESSGNRLMTKLLMISGCMGQDGHEQDFDTYVPHADQTQRNIVWRISVPGGKNYRPNILYMVHMLQSKNYDVQVVVMTRDWHCVTHSQSFHLKIDKDLALHRTREAYLHIFDQLRSACVPFVVVTYGGLVLSQEKGICALLDMLELPYGDMADFDEVIRNGNEKYYSDEGEQG